MAVKIRLTRIGEKKVPLYRIVVADAATPRSGRAIATIGTYDPNTDPSTVVVDVEEAKKWLANGAQPTTVVRRLFKQAGIK
jgi:small subunit ribosomal protein S16